MIKIVGYLFILLSFSVNALVPVEGIIMGEAREDIQSDPLRTIFSEIYDKSDGGENRKLKLYQSTYQSGRDLQESCSYLGAPVYTSSWSEKQARRTVAATLQYIGLDTSIKAIGAYAKKLNVGEEEFKKLKTNLVTNYCSKNITIFSLKTIEKSLEYYYKNPEENIIPSITTSPFATEISKTITEKDSSRSKEFDLVIRNFRSFCSWGSEVEDYRMLTPYLNNPFIMSFVFKNMLGIQDKIDFKQFKVVTGPSSSTVQITCTDLICRKTAPADFKAQFPLSSGSTGIATDLNKMYCHHFRYQDLPQRTVKEIKEWIKSYELEDPIFETSQFISLMTGVPDFLNASESYLDIALVARSSVDERWTKWANSVLSSFSKDLLYEESLRVKVEPQEDLGALYAYGFKIDFSITLGELDRLLVDKDKLKLRFDLKLSKNYLRHLLTRSIQLDKDVDEEGRKKLREEMAHYLNVQLKDKQKYFTQKMWNEDFGRIIGDELLRQVRLYRGPLFDSYKDEMLSVPVNFSYGLFALSYIKYRADVAAGRLKLNL